jgi:hypothetical protein
MPIDRSLEPGAIQVHQGNPVIQQFDVPGMPLLYLAKPKGNFLAASGGPEGQGLRLCIRGGEGRRWSWAGALPSCTGVLPGALSTP